jgi:hypothetical protein
MATLTDVWLSKAAKRWDSENLSYAEYDQKNQAHTLAARLLRHFARHVLYLNDKQFTVRSNKAGIACSGEVTLHTDPFDNMPYGIYIQIGQGCGTDTILYRACKDRADYHGFRNQWITVSKAFASNDAMNEFGNIVRSLCSNANQSRI